MSYNFHAASVAGAFLLDHDDTVKRFLLSAETRQANHQHSFSVLVFNSRSGGGLKTAPIKIQPHPGRAEASFYPVSCPGTRRKRTSSFCAPARTASAVD